MLQSQCEVKHNVTKAVRSLGKEVRDTLWKEGDKTCDICGVPFQKSLAPVPPELDEWYCALAQAETM